MKKIFTIAVLVCVCNVVFAQHHCDLTVVNLTYPVKGTTIRSDAGIPIAFTIKNLGPDSIETKDTIYIYLGTNGIINYAFSPYRVVSTILAKDSTIDIIDTFSGGEMFMHWSGYAHDSDKSFCINVMPHNGSSTDPVTDLVLSNNSDCADSVHMLNVHTNISKSKEEVSLYPNPFSDHAVLKIENNSNLKNTGLVITDLSGRVVKQLVITGNETIINRNGLADGMYFYTVFCNGETVKGKFVVQ
jgi:hypothetical protein